MIISRRNFLRSALAAPAVIAIDRLMPVKLFSVEPSILWSEVGTLKPALYDWTGLFLASGSVISFKGDEVTITHDADLPPDHFKLAYHDARATLNNR